MECSEEVPSAFLWDSLVDRGVCILKQNQIRMVSFEHIVYYCLVAAALAIAAALAAIIAVLACLTIIATSHFLLY